MSNYNYPSKRRTYSKPRPVKYPLNTNYPKSSIRPSPQTKDNLSMLNDLCQGLLGCGSVSQAVMIGRALELYLEHMESLLDQAFRNKAGIAESLQKERKALFLTAEMPHREREDGFGRVPYQIHKKAQELMNQLAGKLSHAGFHHNNMETWPYDADGNAV